MNTFTLTNKGTLEDENGSRFVKNYAIKLIKDGHDVEINNEDGYNITNEFLISLITMDKKENLIDLAANNGTETLLFIIRCGGLDEFKKRKG